LATRSSIHSNLNAPLRFRGTTVANNRASRFAPAGRHPFFGFALRRGRVELRLPCGNLGGVLP
jgi:hypothetical protein